MAKTLTTHILDLSFGRPAANVPVRVEKFLDNQWTSVSTVANTDQDGRAFNLVSHDQWQAGRWRIIFDISSYQSDAFYPAVTIEFQTQDSSHHHIPLLLNKYGYSTYRGS